MSDVPTLLLVPRGLEATAVRRGAPGARIREIAPAAAAGGDAARIEPVGLVVVLGLCGALRGLRVGEPAVYRSVADARGVVPCAPLALPDARTVGACTADHVVTTVAERRELAARFDADVVDMEGTHVARTLAARGIRVAMVRVVSDGMERELPALTDAISADGRVNGLRLALAFMRAPRRSVAFVRDVVTALRALTTLAATLHRRPELLIS